MIQHRVFVAVIGLVSFATAMGRGSTDICKLCHFLTDADLSISDTIETLERFLVESFQPDEKLQSTIHNVGVQLIEHCMTTCGLDMKRGSDPLSMYWSKQDHLSKKRHRALSKQTTEVQGDEMDIEGQNEFGDLMRKATSWARELVQEEVKKSLDAKGCICKKSHRGKKSHRAAKNCRVTKRLGFAAAFTAIGRMRDLVELFVDKFIDKEVSAEVIRRGCDCHGRRPNENEEEEWPLDDEPKKCLKENRIFIYEEKMKEEVLDMLRTGVRERVDMSVNRMACQCTKSAIGHHSIVTSPTDIEDETTTPVTDEEGDSEEGDTEEGDTEEGDTEEGDTEEGDTEEGDTEEGDTEEGDTEGKTSEKMSMKKLLMSRRKQDVDKECIKYKRKARAESH